MSSSRERQLQVVLELAERDMKTAAQQLSLHQQRLQKDRQQLQQLQEYHQSYITKIAQQKQVSVSELLSYRDFSRQLAVSIDQFQGRVQQMVGTCDHLRQKWLQLQQKCDVLMDMIQRCRQEEQQTLDLREQKEMDDLSRRRNSSDHWPASGI